MDAQPVLDRLAQAGLASVKSDLARLLQPAIRVTPQRAEDSALAIGASRLGGAPDLPTGTAWPRGKSGSLGFIAQIRLDDVKGLAGADALPESGWLLFFYDATQETYGDDPDSRGNWQVLYAPANATLQRASLPDDLPAEARYQTCTVTFSEELTLPVQPELEIPGLSWSDDEKTQYEQALATFPTPEEHGTFHTRLLGHPDTLQDDMRVECQLASHGISSPDDPRAAPLIPDANQWRLLLQVDSDDRAGMRWASAGMLYFWIESVALAEQRFDNTWVVLQSD